ncbi:sulfatase [Paraglaciecola sp. L3A3]|uniref:sulfatase family protein n=1 Tax=Paraglaciecola sp. L3A3 TaxID=2686358 RepID=UPI00131C27E3|nr:sulfatase [Paraglaciecola sp. L3A3]
MSCSRYIKSANYQSFILMIALLSLVSCSAVPAQVNSTDKVLKPNFVWIISEDNSPQYLRLYNPEFGAVMPNVEQMAKQGITYDNAYSNAPVCSTARSTLALGVYPAQAGTMHHRAFVKAKYKSGLKSIYQLMKDAGYYVTNNAKTDFNFSNFDSIDFSASSPSASWKNRKNNQAFFHIKTLNTTHESKLMFPASDMVNKPTQHDPSKVKLALFHPDTELFRYMHARYLDLHQKLDEQIGEILTELEEAGELENTFVFYFGDHGGVLPGSKSFANESGIKIPLVVRIPENYQHLVTNSTVKNSRSDDFVSFVDMAPTLLHLSGLRKSNLHSGQAFLGRDLAAKNKYVFAYADRFGERYDLVRTLRVGDLKYVRNYLPMNPLGLEQNYRYKNVAYQQWRNLYKSGQLNGIQSAFFQPKDTEALYDLSNDPEELHNLAKEPQYQKDLRNLRQQLQQQVKSIADLGFVSEAHLERYEYLDSLQLGNDLHTKINKMIEAADLMLLPFDQARSQLMKNITIGSENEQYWSLVALSYFAEQANELTPQIKLLLKQPNTSDLVKARAIEFMTRTGQMDPVSALTSLIENSQQQLEALEIMNIAASLHDTLGYEFDISARPEWSSLPIKSAVDYTTKSYQNGSVKARIEYLKTPWSSDLVKLKNKNINKNPVQDPIDVIPSNSQVEVSL